VSTRRMVPNRGGSGTIDCDAESTVPSGNTEDTPTTSMGVEMKRLREERNAVILAHVYQRAEVQDIADYVGDSLDLSKKAMAVNADVVVFCGVRFMAETAAILNPNKTVLLPDPNAGCGLADMATEKQVGDMTGKYPRATIVSYVNSSAAIKAKSHVCCTSANAVRVVASLSDNPILFVPDRNLGSYVAEEVGKDIILWDGYCYVHENITTNQLESLKEDHPRAEVIVHPECPSAVRQMADFIGGTAQMSQYVANSPHRKFIVGTDCHFAYRLKRDNPDKEFYPVRSLCLGMNEITLEKVRSALQQMKYQIRIPDAVRDQAKIALDRMLAVS
jgi:quinolinate synthase